MAALVQRSAPRMHLAARLLDDNPDMAAELVSLAKAEARVAAAQAAMAEFEAQVAGSSDEAQAQAAAERGADEEVTAAQAELRAAEARLQQASAARREALAAAGPLAQLLSGGGGGSSGTPKWTQPVNDGAERIESAKAAVAAGLAGAFAAAPLAAAAPAGASDLAVVLASCALFGVVYRYALRRDLGNPHLKGGVVASFGLVRGLAQAQLFIATAAPAGAAPTFEQAAQAALLVGEAVVTFALAAAAVEACFSRGIISTFPVEDKQTARDLLTQLLDKRVGIANQLAITNSLHPSSSRSMTLQPSAADVRDVRRVLASWSLERYISIRDEQRAIGEAPRELVWLRHNATLEEALQSLSHHRILSAPILDAYSGEFVGFFSLGDLLKWLLKGLYPSLLAPELQSPETMLNFIRSAAVKNLNLNDLASWAKSGFLSEHLVRPGEDGDICYRGFTDTNFLDLISHGLKRSSPDQIRFGDFEPSHRIAIYDELPDGKMKVVEIVSQSDVLRALLRDKDALGAFPAVHTVEELFGRKEVLTVPSDMPAIAAFALMRNLDISGVPVVDSVSGHMVANLSVSDLRCLRTPDDFDLLGLEAIRFAHARWESEANLEGLAQAGAQPPTPGAAVPAQQERSKRPAVVTVAMDASLLHVMECLVRFRVHRVYVEEKARPVSVVTITDVLRLFAVDPNDDREGLLSF